jgi:3-oxoacyl-[acyl-carrier protein] reductase
VLARRVAADGVTLNTILPGRIATERALATVGDAPTGIPAGRLGTAEEIGAAVAFLASEPAGYITGTTLLVDGGLTVSA